MRICPKCNFENNSENQECLACGINIQWAKLNPDQWTKINLNEIDYKAAEKKRAKIEAKQVRASSTSNSKKSSSISPNTSGFVGQNKMVEYDPNVIRQFANALYKRANTIVAVYLIIGIIIGFTIGSLVGAANKNITSLGLLIGVFAGGSIGYVIGQDKAFFLRLQAQLVLCQVQIEMNTRSSS